MIRIRDPIHGSIRLSSAELAIVDSRLFQRLRGIKQLGFSDQAFPGATHTRYSHSLGAMKIATLMFDALFPESRARLPTVDRSRLRQTLRLGLLLHDIGHPPGSHAGEACMPRRAELELSCFTPTEQAERATHEDYAIKIVADSELTDLLRRKFGEMGVDPADICHLISGRFPERSPRFTIDGINYFPLLSQIVSGEMDADRMDYLQRDSFFAGVSYGKFDQSWLLENLTYHLTDNGAFMALSHQAVFAFEDFLLSRYHMFVSVYYHHRSVAYETMLGRYFEEAPQEFSLPSPSQAHPYSMTDDVALWSTLRASSNPWARRIAERQAYRRLLEVNADAGPPAVDAINAIVDALEHRGVAHFVCRYAGVLSNRHRTDPHDRPIYVSHRALGWFGPMDKYSKLFERYAQPTKLVRLYCDPAQWEAAKACMRDVVPSSTLGLS